MSNFEAIRASFDPKHLRCLMPFMAVHDIRYYLNGICVEKAESGGVYLIGCDGRTMCVIHDATGTIEGADNLIFRVGPGLASAAKMAAKKMHKNLKYRMLVQGHRVKIACDFGSEGDAEIFVQAGRSLIEGKFPDWRKVVPSFDKLKRGAFGGADDVNAIFLARLANLSDDKRFNGISLWQEGEHKPVVVRVQRMPEMIVILMPMRGDVADPLTAFKGFPMEKVNEQQPELEAA